jgi:hypothetical protein
MAVDGRIMQLGCHIFGIQAKIYFINVTETRLWFSAEKLEELKIYTGNEERFVVCGLDRKTNIKKKQLLLFPGIYICICGTSTV